MFVQGPEAAAASVMNDHTERERRTEGIKSASNRDKEGLNNKGARSGLLLLLPVVKKLLLPVVKKLLLLLPAGEKKRLLLKQRKKIA
jgi:hypothetical protein